LKTLFFYFFISFLAAGCASAHLREASGKKYTSSIPPLEVEFAYHIKQDYDHGRDIQIEFANREVKPIWVELEYLNTRAQKIEHFYSLKQIASNLHFCFLEEVYFNGHKWVKVAKENGKGYLMCGYMTRKDKWMIFIHNYTPLTSSELDSYREYQKTLKLSQADEKLINMLFDNLDRSIISIQ
jgi:hypothetical protein